MSKPGDSETKDFKLDGGAGANGGLMPTGYSGQTPSAGGGAGLMNSSSIEQQLDLKYKAYSTMMQNQPGTAQKAAAMGTGTPSGMLPNSSQYLYANANLRTSLDKPLSTGKYSFPHLSLQGV